MHQGVIKKLTLLTFLCSFAAQVYAVAPGFYMGLMGGPATNTSAQRPLQVFPLPTQAQPQANTVQGNPRSMLFGSRIYIGNKFNQYAAFEFGIDYFSTIKYTLGKTLKNNPNNPIIFPTKAAGGIDARVRAIDIVGKLEFSFRDTVDLFGKAGIAAVYTTTPGGLNVQNFHIVTTHKRSSGKTSMKVVNSGSNAYANKIVPTFAFGGAYDLTQNWVADVSFTTILVGGNIKNVSMFTIGLSYHFVDVFCGQFLCDD